MGRTGWFLAVWALSLFAPSAAHASWEGGQDQGVREYYGWVAAHDQTGTHVMIVECVFDLAGMMDEHFYISILTDEVFDATAS